MNKTQQRLNKVILLAMFSALCCAGVFVQIKMPAGDMVHLGNFVMITAALLLGGIEGGIVGSLGMGLYDLIFYTSKPSTIIRTFILKFLIGFIVGSLFRYIIKRKKNVKTYTFVLSAIFLVLFIVSLTFIILGENSGFKSTYVLNLFNKTTKLTISYYIPIFTFIFMVGLLLVGIFINKFNNRTKAALFAITVAVLVNILGEFILRWFLEGIMVSDFKTSLVTATSKIPGSLITGVVSVILSALIYEPIYKAVKNTKLIDDVDVEEIDE